MKSPALISFIVPSTPKGTIILWRTTAVSWTVPITSPAETLSPTLAVGTKGHFFSLFKDLTSTPLLKKAELAAFMKASRGLCIPSNIDSISPGPNSTESGSPVVITGSPGPIPDVSSYTWIEALSPLISMISPIRPFSPTFTTSYTLASSIPSATTKGPETLIIFPVFKLSTYFL